MLIERIRASPKTTTLSTLNVLKTKEQGKSVVEYSTEPRVGNTRESIAQINLHSPVLPI